MLKDKFVWAKVDSDVQKDLKKVYGQTGYPMIVVLNPEGEVVKTLKGFKDADTLSRKLNDYLRTAKAEGALQ